MTVTETLSAFESRLITEAEAVEQAMCDSLDQVYERSASETVVKGGATADEFRGLA